MSLIIFIFFLKYYYNHVNFLETNYLEKGYFKGINNCK